MLISQNKRMSYIKFSILEANNIAIKPSQNKKKKTILIIAKKGKKEASYAVAANFFK